MSLPPGLVHRAISGIAASASEANSMVVIEATTSNVWSFYFRSQMSPGSKRHCRPLLARAILIISTEMSMRRTRNPSAAK